VGAQGGGGGGDGGGGDSSDSGSSDWGSGSSQQMTPEMAYVSGVFFSGILLSWTLYHIGRWVMSCCIRQGPRVVWQAFHTVCGSYEQYGKHHLLPPFQLNCNLGQGYGCDDVGAYTIVITKSPARWRVQTLHYP